MNAMLAMFYSDVMRRYFRSSAFYQQAGEAFDAAKGKDWDAIHNAAFVLAEREGYLAFLAAFRLGLMMGAELEELSPSSF